MGIRFFCPNGHKLHVKTFQAGRRGICPHCGASMAIPLESTRKGSKRLVGPQATPQPVAAPVVPSWEGPADDAPASPAAEEPAIGSGPFQEAPNAVWYVRPPAGGQFGPATSDVMKTWVAEGRVSADSLVWREGWRDWREAGQVFPHLGGTDFVPGLQAILPQEPLEYHPVTGAYSRRGDKSSPGARFGLILAIVVPLALLLLAALVWWLNSGP